MALRTAREVAEKTGRLFAGNICNTNICKGDADDELKAKIRAMFDEQVRWAKEEGAEFIIGETFQYMKEAMIALGGDQVVWTASSDHIWSTGNTRYSQDRVLDVRWSAY